MPGKVQPTIGSGSDLQLASKLSSFHEFVGKF